MSAFTLLRPLAHLRQVNRPFLQSIKTHTNFYNSFASRNFSTTRIVNTDRKYTQKHEWISMDGNVGTVGISDYAQESLGDIVYCQLPELGTELTQFEEAGAVESVKAASELYSPATGQVVEVNESLCDTPVLINKSSYDQGWMYKMKVTEMGCLRKLMNEKEYQEYIKCTE